MRSTAILAVVAIVLTVAVLAGQTAAQSCPFDANAQGLTAYYGTVNSSYYGPGSYSKAQKYNVIIALDGPLTSNNPYLNPNGTMGIPWSGVYRSNEGTTPNKCSCDGITNSQCVPPFTVTAGRCNAVPGAVSTTGAPITT